MDTTARSYDVITMGRSCIDLYSNDIGAPLVEISSFAAYVGGCPTNISVGTRRLGLRPALLTAVGDDQVGNFIAREADLVIGIGTRYSDFTTSSKTAFQHPEVRFININVAAFDASKHLALPLVGDAQVTLEELLELLGGGGKLPLSTPLHSRPYTVEASYRTQAERLHARCLLTWQRTPAAWART